MNLYTNQQRKTHLSSKNEKEEKYKSTLQIELDIVEAFEDMKTHLNQKSKCQEQKWTKQKEKEKS